MDDYGSNVNCVTTITSSVVMGRGWIWISLKALVVVVCNCDKR